MLTALEQFDLSQILQPIQRPEIALQDAVKWGANLTITRGMAVGIKTSDNLAYPMNLAATDGTQNFVGFSMYTFKTDANSLCYQGTNQTSPSFRLGPFMTMPIWIKGIFDPQDLSTMGSGTATAEVDTFTPGGTITTGDIYSVTNASGDELAAFTIGATATAAAAVTGLTNSWNSNPVAVALATPSGSTTFILTAVNAGYSLNLTAKAVGVGTFAKVQTTAPVSGLTAQVLTFTPGGTITTGDVDKLTYTAPDGTQTTASFTVGGTTTAAAVSAGLIAAWNGNSTLKAIATASGTSTVILTSAVSGNADSVAGSVTGVGTLTKAVTTAALGRNIADIQASLPAARVLHNGFWYIP